MHRFSKKPSRREDRPPVRWELVKRRVIGITVRTIAEARASEEAREGLAAFFEKRKPVWKR